MLNNLRLGTTMKLLVGLLAGGLALSTLHAQSSKGKESSAVTPAPAAAPVPSPLHKKVSPYSKVGHSQNASDFYQLHWGVDSFSAKLVESGEMVRFSYRVTDADKAKPLNDKKSAPFLLDEQAHVKLVVPTLEKVGALRQSATPQEGKLYWMVFSNKGRFVKSGDRVSVVIGKFRADEVVVQ